MSDRVGDDGAASVASGAAVPGSDPFGEGCEDSEENGDALPAHLKVCRWVKLVLWSEVST